MFNVKQATLAALALMIGFAAHAADYRPGEVIVKYKDGVQRTRSESAELYNAAGVKSIQHFTGTMVGFEQVFLQDNVKVQDAIAAFMKSDKVEYAQPNYLVHAYPIFSGKHTRSGIPCIPGMNIPGCDPSGGGAGGGGGIPGLPGGGGGGGIPCIPGMNIPGCDPNGGGAGGGGIPGLPGGGGSGGNPLCGIIPNMPGCDTPTPGPTPTGAPTPGPTSTSVPTTQRPDLQSAPAEVNPPVADPNVGQAWGLSKIGATDAWKVYSGSKDFIVADIDTGIDYNHEDLAFNVWRNPNPTQKDVIGWDVVHNDGLPYDDQGHGTHTAGTIGAVGGNGKGVSGVAYRISIMAVKFLDSQGSGDTAGAVKAIDYAVTHGARVLSNSWGGPADNTNQVLLDAINRAEAKGVLFIAAAGNGNELGVAQDDDSASTADFPAGFNTPNEIAVAATDETDQLAFFSNFGANTVSLAAPGVNVYSTWPGNQYKSEDGTSMACPHVAGAAALLWSRHPDWDYKKVKATLLSSVDKIPSLAGKTVTGGRLNILTALRTTE